MAASALTSIHPGAGRAPGAVDLPVVRDALGYPYIRGSMVKGALKTLLARRLGCRYKQVGPGGNHFIDCERSGGDCRRLCCLLGGEVGEGDKGASAVSVQDFYPILIPAPAFTIEKLETREGQGEVGGGKTGPSDLLGGVVYVTTEALLARAQAYAQAAGFIKIADVLGGLSANAGGGCNATLYTSQARAGGRLSLFVAGQLLEACTSYSPAPGQLSSLLGLGRLNSLYSRYPIEGRLLVLRDDVGRMLVERLMERATRVALDRLTKTVAEGHLWTEEYLPWGTLFISLLIETGFTNKEYCGHGAGSPGTVYELESIIARNLGNVVVVGGKESVGGGLLKLGFAAAGGTG